MWDWRAEMSASGHEPLTPGADASSLEAERSVLGAILMHPEAYARVPFLSAPDFFRLDHGRIFAQMTELERNGEAIDFVTLHAALARSGDLNAMGGPAYLAALCDGIPRASNIEHYARIVKGGAWARAIVTSARGAIEIFSRDPAALSNGQGERYLETVRNVVSAAHEASDDAGEALSQTVTEFLADAPEPVPPLIQDFIPGSGISLPHGQPRARKSLMALEALIAGSACVPPFGLARLVVTAPIVTWYLTEEDNAGEVKKRIRALLAGRDLQALPDGFRVSAQKGLTLDDVRTQDRLIREVIQHNVRLLTLDPIRSLSSAVDKGPGDLQPLVKSLRRIMRETGVVLQLVHHDTKLRADGKPDDRPRAQRASGGGILSIAEAPLHLDRVSDDVTLIVPNLWKFSADPPPIKVRFESTPGRLRLIGEDVEASAANDLAIHERVIAALRDHGASATSRVATAVRARKEDVTRALEQLAAAGKVDSVKAGNATRWFLKGGQS